MKNSGNETEGQAGGLDLHTLHRGLSGPRLY